MGRMIPYCGEFFYNPDREGHQCVTCNYRNEVDDCCDYWKHHNDAESIVLSEAMEAKWIADLKGHGTYVESDSVSSVYGKR